MIDRKKIKSGIYSKDCDLVSGLYFQSAEFERYLKEWKTVQVV
jgi:hypothetical protein